MKSLATFKGEEKWTYTILARFGNIFYYAHSFVVSTLNCCVISHERILNALHQPLITIYVYYIIWRLKNVYHIKQNKYSNQEEKISPFFHRVLLTWSLRVRQRVFLLSFLKLECSIAIGLFWDCNFHRLNKRAIYIIYHEKKMKKKETSLCDCKNTSSHGKYIGT